MKKFLALCLAFVLIFSLAACGSEPAAESKPAEEAAPSAEEAPAEVRHFSVGTGGSAETAPVSDGARAFAEKLEELSGGTMVCDIYYGSTLGSTQDIIDGVQLGTVDFAEAGSAYFTAYMPELMALDLPFLWDSYDQVRTVLDGAPLEYIQKGFEGTGIKILGIWEVGFRHHMNDVKPVNCMEDIAGMTMRTQASEIQVSAWNSFGAEVTAIDYSELYAALQQGVVVSNEQPFSEMINTKLYEVQKYITLTNHMYQAGPWAVSEATWNSLTEEQQGWVVEATKAGTAACRAANEAVEANAISIMEEAGCVINTEPDLTGFKEAAPAVYPIFTDKYGSALLDIIYESIEEYNNAQ